MAPVRSTRKGRVGRGKIPGGGLGTIAPPTSTYTPSLEDALDTSTFAECDPEGFSGWCLSAHACLRWPLFILGCLIIACLIVLYAIIRALISVVEWLFAPAVVLNIRRTMAKATSYEEWRNATECLDKVTGRDAWKSTQQSRHYAYKLVAAAKAEIEVALEDRDHMKLLRCLQQVLRDVNFAGHLSEDLYSKTHSGTKRQIDEFCSTVCAGLRCMREKVEECSKVCDRQLSETTTSEEPEEEMVPGERSDESCDDYPQELLLNELKKFAEFAVCTFGRSALCLSGGGAIALQHLGVVEELFKRGLLPQVISGASGGACVACYVCCRTDAELRGEVAEGPYPLKLDAARMQAGLGWPFHGTKMERIMHYWKHGCLFSSEVWEEASKAWALGDLTFLEAYLRTGRVLNMTTNMKAVDGGKQQAVLLNYQTHPHVLVRSAFLCSSAMPTLTQPARMLEKCPKTGEIKPHSEELFYVDGTIDCDIPVHTLAQTFGVRYTVASQVNPHVTPFLFAVRGEAGDPILWRSGRTGWRGGFLLGASAVLLKELIRGGFKLMGLLDLLPSPFQTKWNFLFTQSYEGSVTLSNNNAYIWKILRAISNPSLPDMLYWRAEGQRMIWRKMALLEKRLLPEAELFRLESALDATTATPRGMMRTPSMASLSEQRRRSTLQKH